MDLSQSHVKVCFCLISLDKYSQQLGASSKLLLALAAKPNKSAAFINWSHLDVLNWCSQVIPSCMCITVRTIPPLNKRFVLKSYSSKRMPWLSLKFTTRCTESHWPRGVKTSGSKSSTSMWLTRHIKTPESSHRCSWVAIWKTIERQLLSPGNEKMVHPGMDLAS